MNSKAKRVVFGTRYKKPGWILKINVHQLSRKQFFEAFCKDYVQDSWTNRFRIKIEVV